MARVTRDIGNVVPTQIQKIVLVPSQIVLLNTNPVILLTLEIGYIPIPIRFHVYKEAGTPYTIGAATGLELGWGPVNASHVILTGLVDQAGEASALGMAPGNNIALYPSLGALQTNTGNLTIFMNTANISGGTGNIECTVIYELWPKLRLSGIS